MEIKRGTLVIVRKDIPDSQGLKEIKYTIGIVRGPADDDSENFSVALAGGSLETLPEEEMTPLLQTLGGVDFPEKAIRACLPEILSIIFQKIEGLKRELNLIQFR